MTLSAGHQASLHLGTLRHFCIRQALKFLDNVGMSFRFRDLALIALICVLVVALPPAVAGRSLSPRPSQKRAASENDSEYVLALASADRLLQAWHTQDSETGIAMLTERAKKRASAEGVESFFETSGSRGYEIVHGRRLRAGMYEFPVVLLSTQAGSGEIHRHFSSIVVSKTSNNDWAVDKLP